MKGVILALSLFLVSDISLARDVSIDLRKVQWSVNVGDECSMKVNTDQVRGLKVINLSISFDHQRLEYKSIVEEDLVKNFMESRVSDSMISNSTGKIEYSATLKTPGPGVDFAGGTILTLYFVAKSPGYAWIRLNGWDCNMEHQGGRPIVDSKKKIITVKFQKISEKMEEFRKGSNAQVRTIVGLGYAKIIYPNNWESLFDLFDTHIGGVNFDVGIYIPFPDNENAIVGVNGSSVVDAYFSKDVSGESISMILDHSLVSLSLIYLTTVRTYRVVRLFPITWPPDTSSTAAKEMKLAPFVRVDAGLSRVGIRFSDTFTNANADSNYGFGLLLSSGLAFPILDERKVLLNLSFSFRHIKEDSYMTLGIGIDYFH